MRETSFAGKVKVYQSGAQAPALRAGFIGCEKRENIMFIEVEVPSGTVWFENGVGHVTVVTEDGGRDERRYSRCTVREDGMIRYEGIYPIQQSEWKDFDGEDEARPYGAELSAIEYVSAQDSIDEARELKGHAEWRVFNNTESGAYPDHDRAALISAFGSLAEAEAFIAHGPAR